MLGLPFCVRYRAYKKRTAPVDFTAQFQALVDSGDLPGQSVDSFRATKTPRELPRAWLALVGQLGSGNFGEVWKGLLTDRQRQGTICEEIVAAKQTLVDDGSEGASVARADLVKEATVMCHVGYHANIVSLIGVVTRGDPLIVVVSYCEHGDVAAVLKRAAADGMPWSLTRKLRMCQEVACGMSHLGQCHVIHRDLASRNVLLTSGNTCKVADFGLSRFTASEYYYRAQAGTFPVKWTAPEAIDDNKYSTASDVWSFAITVVEIIEDGLAPYPGLSNPAVMDLVSAGLTHAQPPKCSDVVYAVLLRCWASDPARRPDFVALASEFGVLVAAAHHALQAGAVPPINATQVPANNPTRANTARNTYEYMDSLPPGDASQSHHAAVGSESGQDTRVGWTGQDRAGQDRRVGWAHAHSVASDLEFNSFNAQAPIESEQHRVASRSSLVNVKQGLYAIRPSVCKASGETQPMNHGHSSAAISAACNTNPRLGNHPIQSVYHSAGEASQQQRGRYGRRVPKVLDNTLTGEQAVAAHAVGSGARSCTPPPYGAVVPRTTDAMTMPQPDNTHTHFYSVLGTPSDPPLHSAVGTAGAEAGNTDSPTLQAHRAYRTAATINPGPGIESKYVQRYSFVGRRPSRTSTDSFSEANEVLGQASLERCRKLEGTHMSQYSEI